MDFAVAGAFELFEDHFVHPAAGVDQGGGNDGQAAAFLDLAGGTEEALGPLQGVGVHATGQHLAGGGHHVVVGAGQTGDGVQQDDDILLQFHQALGALDHHFGHMHVAGGGLVKGGGDHLALHGALHFSHFFRTLVHQQHHQVHVGVIGRDRVGDVLHHHRLARLGLRHDQRALATADRGNDVDHAAGDVFFRLDVALEPHLLLGKQRRQVLEHHLVLVLLGRPTVDGIQLGQREVAFAVLGRAHLAFDHVARVQVEPPHLAGRNVDVVGAGGVAGVGAAQEAETVRQDLQHAVGKDLFAGAGAFLDDRKHQLLLAHAAGVFDFEIFGLLEDFRHVKCLEFV